MRDPIRALANAIERDAGGLAVVYCPDLPSRDWLVREVAAVAEASGSALRTASVDEALKSPDRVTLLVPDNETTAVEELDGRRDQFLEPRRSRPVVLFLIRDGDGQRALADAPSLASWLRGNDVDPEALAEVDVTAERAKFEVDTGETPEAWLASWRRGAFKSDVSGMNLSFRAMFLEQR